jgi:hypothetical protein
MSQMYTRAPAAAKACAVTRPMPLAAAVISTRWPAWLGVAVALVLVWGMMLAR